MGGGFGVVTAEDCEKEGLEIASLEPQTLKKMAAVLPPRWTPGNPVDLVGTRPRNGENIGDICLRLLLEDRNVDGIISLLPPMVMLSALATQFSQEQILAMKAENDKNQEKLYQQVKKYDKPLVYIRRMNIYYVREPDKPDMPPKVIIPEYAHPRRAARVLRYLANYRRYLEGS
jgi:acyl-CoA synthetase (NDP forming)